MFSVWAELVSTEMDKPSKAGKTAGYEVILARNKLEFEMLKFEEKREAKHLRTSLKSGKWRKNGKNGSCRCC
jgi:hypothetical protein